MLTSEFGNIRKNKKYYLDRSVVLFHILKLTGKKFYADDIPVITDGVSITRTVILPAPCMKLRNIRIVDGMMVADNTRKVHPIKDYQIFPLEESDSNKLGYTMEELDTYFGKMSKFSKSFPLLVSELLDILFNTFRSLIAERKKIIADKLKEIIRLKKERNTNTYTRNELVESTKEIVIVLHRLQFMIGGRVHASRNYHFSYYTNLGMLRDMSR